MKLGVLLMKCAEVVDENPEGGVVLEHDGKFYAALWKTLETECEEYESRDEACAAIDRMVEEIAA